MNEYLLTFAAAAVTALFLTRICRDAAIRLAWVDRPDSGRKLHLQPVPAVGGIALALSATLALVLGGLVDDTIGQALRSELGRVVSLGVLAGAMLLVGVADDVRSLRPWTKFTLQAIVAVAAWLVGIRIEVVGAYWGDGLPVGILSLPVTVIWLVGITNAFNLLDGIDGLTAGAALFATLALLAVAVSSHEWTTALVLAAIAGATAGFLRYNFNPASIFLGDSGSLFLGFTLAVLAIQSSQKSAATFAVAIPIVSLGLPVLDTTVVVLRRMVSRSAVFAADRRHIHHLLLDRGLSARAVAIALYALCGALAGVALLVASPYAEFVGPALVILGVAVGIGIQQLQIPELRALNAHVVRGLKRQRTSLAVATVIQTMLSRLSAASDGQMLLGALGDAFAQSGVATATLTLPPHLVLDPARGWRGPEAPDSWIGDRVFHWRDTAVAPAATRVLTMPVFGDGRSGTLTIRVDTSRSGDAVLITWLTQGVPEAFGTHLMRVAGLQSKTAGGDAGVAGALVSERRWTDAAAITDLEMQR